MKKYIIIAIALTIGVVGGVLALNRDKPEPVSYQAPAVETKPKLTKDQLYEKMMKTCTEGDPKWNAFCECAFHYFWETLGHDRLMEYVNRSAKTETDNLVINDATVHCAGEV